MAPSNSLLSNLSANNVQLNRADIRNLNVRNNLQIDNQSNYTKDDALLVLITLNIKDANLFENRIEFTKDNLKLTQWTNRTLNSEKSYRFHTNHSNQDALTVLEGLFDKKIQGKYNATDNPPNAVLTKITSFGVDHYITIMSKEINDDNITLYFESEENSPEIVPQTNLDVKIVIDTFKRIRRFRIIYDSLDFQRNTNVEEFSFSTVFQQQGLSLLISSIEHEDGNFLFNFYPGRLFPGGSNLRMIYNNQIIRLNLFDNGAFFIETTGVDEGSLRIAHIDIPNFPNLNQITIIRERTVIGNLSNF